MSVSKILYKSFYWKLFQFLISFLITVVLARLFKPAISKEFYSLLYLLSLITVFFTFGLDISLNYFISRRELRLKQARIIIILVTLIALILSLPFIYFYYRTSLAGVFTIYEVVLFSGLQIGGGLLSVLSGTILTAFNRNHIATASLVLFNFIMLVSILVLNHFENIIHLVRAIFYAWYILVFVQGFSLFIYSGFKFSSKPLLHENTTVKLSKLIRFSYTAFITNFIFLVAGRLPVFILPLFAGSAQIGNFIHAYKLLEYMGAVVSFISFPLVAITAGQNKNNIQSLVLFLVRVFNTATIIFSLGVLALGHVLFPLIFGKEFSSMYGVTICLIPAFVAYCSSSFFTAYFYGIGHLKYNFISACVLIFTILISLFPLAKYYGINGAAMALSIGYVASLLVDKYFFKKQHSFSMRDIFFIRRSDLSSLFSVLMNRI